MHGGGGGPGTGRAPGGPRARPRRPRQVHQDVLHGRRGGITLPEKPGQFPREAVAVILAGEDGVHVRAEDLPAPQAAKPAVRLLVGIVGGEMDAGQPAAQIVGRDNESMRPGIERLQPRRTLLGFAAGELGQAVADDKKFVALRRGAVEEQFVSEVQRGKFSHHQPPGISFPLAAHVSLAAACAANSRRQ